MKRRAFLAAAAVGGASIALPGRSAAGANAGLAPMPARPADALVDNYMVNTRIFYAPSVYGYTDAVMSLIEELGVRIIRERITTGTSLGTRNQLYAMPRLSAAGVRWHGTVGKLEDWGRADQVNADVMDFLVRHYAPQVDGDLAGLLHSFGGCNEIDGAVVDGLRDPGWATHARIMQRALWEQAKAHSGTRNIPIAGPSTRTDVTRARADELGDLSDWSDWGNGHLYNKGASPTREIDEHLSILGPCFPGVDQWIITETGYNNSPQTTPGNNVPEDASAVYVVRGICDFFKRNAIYGRYELLDDPDVIDYTSQSTIDASASREAHFGLVAMTADKLATASPATWRKKPEFYATRRLLRLLADPGQPFSPEPLALGIDGGGADLQTLLLQKRDGRHYLLLWRDIQVCEEYPSGLWINHAPAKVTVSLPTARAIAIHCPNKQDSSAKVFAARQSVTVGVRNSLKIVEIG